MIEGWERGCVAGIVGHVLMFVFLLDFMDNCLGKSLVGTWQLHILNLGKQKLRNTLCWSHGLY